MKDASDVHLPAGFIRDLAAASSEAELLTAAADWMPRVIDAERASLALWDGKASHLTVHTVAGSDVPGLQTIPTVGSMPGTACTTQQVVSTPDVLASAWIEANSFAGTRLRSAMSCPMVSSGQSLGTINVAHSDLDHFQQDHAMILLTIAELIASFLTAHRMAQVEKERAQTDELTGCLNRRAVLERLDQSFASGVGRPSLLYIDVDGFKAINDTYGHLLGDEMLRVLSRRLLSALRAGDAFGRLGGDEFLFVVHDDQTGRIASILARRILERATATIAIGGVSIEPRVSIGVASVDAPQSTPTQLLHDADQAMYVAKRSANRIAYADDAIRAHAKLVETVDRDLEHGMQSGEITYHYQVIRDVETSEIMGAEALIRWQHPEVGAVPASLIVERLEASGRIEAFTRWSLSTIAEDWTRLRASIDWFADKAVSYNVSRRQLSWSGFIPFHLETLELYGLRREDVIIEVVESNEPRSPQLSDATLQQLADEGVLIALDDFGTGRSVLGYLTRFSVHGIKFDRTLVEDAGQSPVARQVLTSLTDLAHTLGMMCLAEGMESEAEVQICREIGIPHGQGWYFGRPMAMSELIETLEREPVPERLAAAAAVQPDTR